MQNQSDFTKEGYITIIKSALQNGYALCPLKEVYKFYKDEKKPVAILRHDVDVDLHAALEMARIESSLGVTSTYFILLYNDLYNPLSSEGRKILMEISGLNHEIGFHWDSHDYNNSQNLDEDIKMDIKILESISGQKILSTAKHRPNHNKYLDVSKYFQNDAYDDKFTKNFVYVSDSCMKWRQHKPIDIIMQRKNFQFLSHPVWWIPDGATVEQKVYSVKKKNMEIRGEVYSEFIKHILSALKDREIKNK